MLSVDISSEAKMIENFSFFFRFLISSRGFDTNWDGHHDGGVVGRGEHWAILT